MQDELLDFFDQIEERFNECSISDDNIVTEVLAEATKRGVKLRESDFENPSNIFLKICTFMGSRGVRNEDGTYRMNQYRDIVCEILNEYGYDDNNNVKLAIMDIQKNPLSQRDFRTYKLEFHGENGYKNIKSIELESDSEYKITVFSGYTYLIKDLVNSDLTNDPELSRISGIVKESLKNDCHGYADKLASILPEGITVTAACPRYFKGNYYLHSFVELGNNVIDLNLGIMMSKEDYYHLMNPQVLARTNNSLMPEKKKEIESLIGNLKSLGLSEWSYILYIAFLNIKENPELLQSIMDVDFGISK